MKDGLPEGTKTILVARDEEEEVRKLAVDILRKRVYWILEASHGNDAFLICQQGKEMQRQGQSWVFFLCRLQPVILGVDDHLGVGISR